jgi:hypothetical protein
MADYNIHVFEKHAREYDRWFETHTYAYESEVRVGIKVGVEPAQAMASIARQRGIEVY